MTIKASVVIPSYRRPELLRRCLKAVLNQTLPSTDYEVIVVDDGDCERTRALVGAVMRGAILGPHVSCIPASLTQGPAGARNVGWRRAVGEVIAFTDDDTVPTSDWLMQGLAAFKPNLAAVCGKVVVPVRGEPTDFERMTKGLEDAEFVTANVFVRKGVLEDLGGFDERFLRAWREDSDLQFRIIRSGRMIGCAPRAVVEHPVRWAPWGVSLMQQRNVFFDALLYKKDPVLYRLKIRSRPPWLYYFVVLSTMLALLAAWVQAWLLASGGILAAGACSVWFAWTRLKYTSRAPSHVLEMLMTSLLIPFLSVYWRLAGAWHFRVRFL